MANEFDYSTDDILNMLTDAMHVDHVNGDSNWVKYFEIWKDTFQDIQDKTNKVHKANDLDNCYGEMLDDEARNVGISRNGVDDDFLRFEIKARLLARICDGTMPMLYQFISTSLGVQPKDFNIQPMYEVDGTPNAIRIDGISANQIDNVRKIKWFISQVYSAVADGIRIEDIIFNLNEKMNLYIGSTITMSEHISNSIGPNIVEKESQKLDGYIGAQPLIYEKIGISTDPSIEETTLSKGKGYIGVQPLIYERIGINADSSIKENSLSSGNGYIGVQPIIYENTGIDAGNSITERFNDNNGYQFFFGVEVLNPYVFAKETIQHYHMSVNDGIVYHSHVDVNNYVGNLTTGGSRVQI